MRRWITRWGLFWFSYQMLQLSVIPLSAALTPEPAGSGYDVLFRVLRFTVLDLPPPLGMALLLWLLSVAGVVLFGLAYWGFNVSAHDCLQVRSHWLLLFIPHSLRSV